MFKKIISLSILSTLLLPNVTLLAEAKTLSSPVKTTKTEHLALPKSVAKKAPTDVVITTSVLTTVIEHNILEVTFAEPFSTKNYKVGDKVSFMLNNGISTKEGTVIFPQGTQVIAEVSELKKPKSFNRSAKVHLLFKEVELPDGRRIPLNAKVFAKKEELSRSKLSIFGKGMGTTLGTMGVGIGAGCGIGVAAGAVVVGGLAIGLPVGLAVGALLGFATPGLHYKAKAGDKLLIQLTDDLDVQN